MADHALEGGAAGLQVGAGEIERRHGGGAAGLRLRHVGARHLADVEAVLGGLQIARQHGDVVLAQANDGLVAHHVDVGGHGLEQHAAFRGAQRLAPRPHGGLGLAHGVDHAKALEERLLQVDRVAARIALVLAGRGRPRGLQLVAGVGVADHHRAEARHGARHLLIGRTQRGARRVEPRVELVGGGQSLRQRLGACADRQQCTPQTRKARPVQGRTPEGALAQLAIFPRAAPVAGSSRQTCVFWRFQSGTPDPPRRRPLTDIEYLTDSIAPKAQIMPSRARKLHKLVISADCFGCVAHSPHLPATTGCPQVLNRVG